MKLETIKKYIEIARVKGVFRSAVSLNNLSSVEEYIELDSQYDFTVRLIRIFNDSIIYDDDFIEYISKDARRACTYAIEVLKGKRFLKGEKVIYKDFIYRSKYVESLDAEEIDENVATYYYLYVKSIIDRQDKANASR